MKETRSSKTLAQSISLFFVCKLRQLVTAQAVMKKMLNMSLLTFLTNRKNLNLKNNPNLKNLKLKKHFLDLRLKTIDTI
jgi:hypothetical protein